MLPLPACWESPAAGSNRTFMELKYMTSGLEFTLTTVLIVPLWNWNAQGGQQDNRDGGSNRTFMELKFFLTFTYNDANLRSNRTFMELKWICWSWQTTSLFVLIVPLWNWNYLSLNFSVAFLCSNRTFMELKWKKEGS